MHRPAATLAVLVLLVAALLGPPARASEPAEVAAVKRLIKAGDPSARASALRRLAGARGRAALHVLLEALSDPHPYVRRAAAGVIAVSPAATDPRARRRLAAELRRRGTTAPRTAACRVFALWADDAGRWALLDALEDRSAAVRGAAVGWLGDPRTGHLAGSDAAAEAVRAAIVTRLEDPDGAVRALALDVLTAAPPAGVFLVPHLADPDPRVRLSALESSVAGASRSDGACPDADGGPAVVAVLRGLDDSVWSVRLLAAELSRAVAHRRLLPALVDRLADERRRVAEAAHRALVALTGIPFEPDPAVWGAWLAADGATFDPAQGPMGGRPPPRDPPPGGRTVARPRFLGVELVSRHVGFVLDASASMRRRLADGTSRWDQARRELDAAVERLAEGRGGSRAVRVNVFVFGDTVEAVFPGAVAPTRGRRVALAKALAAVEPGGRTALFDGVAAALADPDLDTVVVLSDGAPSAGAWFTKTDLLREVRRRNRWRRARIDVIAVGADRTAARWRDAWRQLTEESGGVLVVR